MHDLVEVRARDCACPDSPHVEEGDLVYMLPTLPMEGGMIAESQMMAAAPIAGDGSDKAKTVEAQRQVELGWARTFITYGAVGWNLLDEDGDPVPFDVEDILRDWRFARAVADKATDLYADSVMDPFLSGSGDNSQNGPTASSTSRRPRKTRKSPAPSSPDTTEATPQSTP